MKHSVISADASAQFGAFSGTENHDAINVEQVWAILRRQWRLILGAMVIALALGIGYAYTAVPIYTASASLLIDTSNQKIADQLSSVTGALEDEASVLSQVELLKSDKIAKAVSEKLDLRNNATFMAGTPNVLGTAINFVKSVVNISEWFGSEKAQPTDDDIQEVIANELENNVDVTRVGQTYVLTLEYSSVSASLAAQIARAYADAYLTDQLDSKYDATRRASTWLQARIGELRQKALDTDLAVQKFRAEHGLIAATDGQLVSEQQLTQINSQLILAQADTASAQAKYDRIRSIIDSGNMDATVTESLSSGVITDLQSKYLETSRKEADITSRLGPKHVQSIRLRNEKAEYRRLMFEELARIAQTYQSSLDVAKARQKTLEDQVAAATGTSVTANDAQVQLRELEREADTYKELYKTFLQRYQEAVQQQSFPITEARVISETRKPTKPSAPKKPLIATLSLLAGLVVGAALAGLREFRDRYFRTSDQIRDYLDIDALGIIPLAPSVALRSKGNAEPRRLESIHKNNSISNYVIEHPISSFAETMRSIKIAVDAAVPHKRAKTVGFVSVMPGEGKSTTSINFAELLASQGSRVLLIDADLRNPGATREIGRHAESGLVEALREGRPIRELLMVNPETKLAFLPAVVKSRLSHSSELLASDAMDQIIKEVSELFDYVVFDLPPMAPVVDARAVSSKLDACVLVIGWGATVRAVVRRALLTNAAVAAKCVGAVLNKVDTRKMRFYQNFDSQEFYYSKYSSYYGE
jgi:succinoglycan biosynthesis transport protein ExoP